MTGDPPPGALLCRMRAVIGVVPDETHTPMRYAQIITAGGAWKRVLGDAEATGRPSLYGVAHRSMPWSAAASRLAARPG
ncbi:hypothetical protein AB5J72_48325 [Streptomyces sp. CG1]|uniref:hypothetical protein n=1 Tax=Streptomyces sp. CG1 TaxID=1287523 RepID=UPI0034E302FC